MSAVHFQSPAKRNLVKYKIAVIHCQVKDLLVKGDVIATTLPECTSFIQSLCSHSCVKGLRCLQAAHKSHRKFLSYSTALLDLNISSSSLASCTREVLSSDSFCSMSCVFASIFGTPLDIEVLCCCADIASVWLDDAPFSSGGSSCILSSACNSCADTLTCALWVAIIAGNRGVRRASSWSGQTQTLS